jgi:hypothetical protein
VRFGVPKDTAKSSSLKVRYILHQNRQPTHVPRIQSEERGDNVQTIRGQQGQDDVSENLVAKDFTGIDIATILH